MAGKAAARRWLVRGNVQGVGYRYFARQAAQSLGLAGYTRNLDDGRVEVYAVGPTDRLDDLAGQLRVGPRWADVRGVDQEEAAPQRFSGFEIRQ